MSSVKVDPASEAGYDVVAVISLPVLPWAVVSDSIRPSDVKPTKVAQACSFGCSAAVSG